MLVHPSVHTADLIPATQDLRADRQHASKPLLCKTNEDISGKAWMWLPVHCSESGAETNAETLLAALLPGLILATFLIQLIPTCLGIVG